MNRTDYVNTLMECVNVAMCEYFDGFCMKRDTSCEEGGNCIYKQLIRLEQENRELKAYKDVNEDFKKAWDELNRKYTEVLKLAKENADSNEYCLQELEKKNFTLTQESQQKSQTICELEQENKELKEDLKSQQMINLKQQQIALDYWNALEEIRILATKNVSIENFVKIQNKINEVLNDSEG